VTWDGLTLWFAAARWLGYLAAFLVVGAAAFRWVVLPRRRFDDSGPRTAATAVLWARVGTAGFAVALVARLYFQTRSLLEAEDPITIEFLRAVLSTAWGKGWLVQAGAALLALIGWRWLARRAESRVARWAAIGGTVALVGSAPLTGHAVGLPGAPGYAPVLDLIHFGAGATWLGTLGIIWAVARRQGDQTVAALIDAYSPVALVAGITTMAAGVVMALTYLGGLSPLLSTGYGRTILLKLGATGATAAIGAYNWRVIGPRLRRGLKTPILKSAVAELAVGLLILAITAFLVALPAPSESAD